MGQRMVEVVCLACEKKFERGAGEVKRSAKIGRKTFCSLTCGAAFNNAPKRSKEVVKTCGVETT